MRFNLKWDGPVPLRNSILRWVSNFKITGSTRKKKTGGHARSVRTQEPIEAMEDAVQQFPARAAMKHALALDVSDRSARRVLKFDSKMQPYKIFVTVFFSDDRMGVYSVNAVFCVGVLTNKIIVIWLK